MIFEENVPGCLVEGVGYEADPIAGLLEAGSDQEQEQQQDNVQFIDRENSEQKNVVENTRQSVQVN